jgi:protoporphyrinogen oxidase
MPQYNLGHDARVAGIVTEIRAVTGLHFAANYLHGRSIGECVDSAFRVADSITAPAAIGSNEQEQRR